MENKIDNAMKEFNKIISIYKNIKTKYIIYYNGSFIPIHIYETDYLEFQLSVFIFVDINELFNNPRKNKCIIGRKSFFDLLKNTYILVDVEATYEYINNNDIISLLFDTDLVLKSTKNEFRMHVNNDFIKEYVINNPILNKFKTFYWLSEKSRSNEIKHSQHLLHYDDILKIMNSHVPVKIKLLDNKYIYISKNILNKKICKNDSILDLYYTDKSDYGLFVISSKFDETYRYIIQFISIILDK